MRPRKRWKMRVSRLNGSCPSGCQQKMNIQESSALPVHGGAKARNAAAFERIKTKPPHYPGASAKREMNVCNPLKPTHHNTHYTAYSEAYERSWHG